MIPLHLIVASNIETISPWTLLATYLFVFLSLTSFGALMDCKKYAIYLEITRCLLYLVFDIILFEPMFNQEILKNGVRWMFIMSTFILTHDIFMKKKVN